MNAVGQPGHLVDDQRNPKSRSIPVPHTRSSLPTILGETYYSCDGHGLGPSRFRVQGRDGLWFKVQVSKGKPSKRDFPCRARQGEYFNFWWIDWSVWGVSDCDRVGLSRDTVQASGMEVEMSSEMSVAEIVETVEAATATAPPGMRLVITKMVLHNFKSYYGNVEVGPFHKVSLCSDTRLHSPASKSERLCACARVCVVIPCRRVPRPSFPSQITRPLSLSLSLSSTLDRSKLNCKIDSTTLPTFLCFCHSASHRWWVRTALASPM